MKDEMGDVAVEELVGLKLKVNSNLVNNSNEYKKGKGYMLLCLCILLIAYCRWYYLILGSKNCT